MFSGKMVCFLLDKQPVESTERCDRLTRKRDKTSSSRYRLLLKSLITVLKIDKLMDWTGFSYGCMKALVDELKNIIKVFKACLWDVMKFDCQSDNIM